MAALAQNGDGLRADQAGTSNDDEIHSLPSCSMTEHLNGFEMQVRKTHEWLKTSSCASI